MSVVAGIDCGTNSIRLLIGEGQKTPTGGIVWKDILRRMEVVRLGEGVDKTGRLSEAALERTFQKVSEYAQLIRQHGAEKVMMMATSASRDAENSAEFVAGVKQRLGIEPQVISGDEEAELTFLGALSALPEGLAEPYLIVDIGGGSTEFSRGDHTGVKAGISTNMGCVRFTERFWRQARQDNGGIVPPELIAQAKAAANELIDRADAVVDLASVKTLIGVGGTITTVTAMGLGLAEYDADTIDGSSLAPEEIRAQCDWLAKASLEEIAAVGSMHPGRVEIITSGSLIWGEIVSRTQAANPAIGNVYTSEHDILDGIAQSLL